MANRHTSGSLPDNFCPHCGNTITTNDKFCPFCGFDLQQFKKDNARYFDSSGQADKDDIKYLESTTSKKNATPAKTLDSFGSNQPLIRKFTKNKIVVGLVAGLLILAVILIFIIKASGGQNLSTQDSSQATTVPGVGKAKNFAADVPTSFQDAYDKYGISLTDDQSKITIMKNNDSGDTTFKDGPYEGEANKVTDWYLYKVSWADGDSQYYIYLRGVYKIKNDVQGEQDINTVNVPDTDSIENNYNFSGAKTYQLADF